MPSSISTAVYLTHLESVVTVRLTIVTTTAIHWLDIFGLNSRDLLCAISIKVTLKVIYYQYKGADVLMSLYSMRYFLSTSSKERMFKSYMWFLDLINDLFNFVEEKAPPGIVKREELKLWIFFQKLFQFDPQKSIPINPQTAWMANQLNNRLAISYQSHPLIKRLPRDTQKYWLNSQPGIYYIRWSFISAYSLVLNSYLFLSIHSAATDWL